MRVATDSFSILCTECYVVRILNKIYAVIWADENCALLGYYAASSSNSLPTFRDNL